MMIGTSLLLPGTAKQRKAIVGKAKIEQDQRVDPAGRRQLLHPQASDTI